MALRYKPCHCHLMMLVLEEGEHCSRPHLQPLLQLLLADAGTVCQAGQASAAAPTHVQLVY